MGAIPDRSRTAPSWFDRARPHFGDGPFVVFGPSLPPLIRVDRRLSTVVRWFGPEEEWWLVQRGAPADPR